MNDTTSIRTAPSGYRHNECHKIVYRHRIRYRVEHLPQYVGCGTAMAAIIGGEAVGMLYVSNVKWFGRKKTREFLTKEYPGCLTVFGMIFNGDLHDGHKDAYREHVFHGEKVGHKGGKDYGRLVKAGR